MKTTPMMKQWFYFRKKCPDTVLLVRMGDFYETFDDDAQILSDLTGVSLTKRGTIRMAGVPHHAKDQYAKKLLQAGHKVAIVEPIAEELVNPGIKRDVVRVTDNGITTIPNP